MSSLLSSPASDFSRDWQRTQDRVAQGQATDTADVRLLLLHALVARSSRFEQGYRNPI